MVIVIDIVDFFLSPAHLCNQMKGGRGLPYLCTLPAQAVQCQPTILVLQQPRARRSTLVISRPRPSLGERRRKRSVDFETRGLIAVEDVPPLSADEAAHAVAVGEGLVAGSLETSIPKGCRRYEGAHCLQG